MFKITFRGKLFTPSLVIFSVPILMIIFERFIYHFAGFSLPYWFYYNAESWRELSLYSSIYGSQLIGPFSGGSAWPSLMANGQEYFAMDENIREWLIWPWSFLSMLLLEIGILPTIIFLYYVGYRLDNVWRKRKDLRPQLKWYTISITIGLLLAPKWCVYFFFFPIYMIENKTFNKV